MNIHFMFCEAESKFGENRAKQREEESKPREAESKYFPSANLDFSMGYGGIQAKIFLGLLLTAKTDNTAR